MITWPAVGSAQAYHQLDLSLTVPYPTLSFVRRLNAAVLIEFTELRYKRLPQITLV